MHAGTAEPLRVSPPEAVAYPLELYRIARSVPLTATRRVWGTLVEVWEHDRRGQPLYHNAWFTDLEVTADNVAAIVCIGRSRWKIENEQFNIQKNHGYELEHNYGHGQQTLSMVFYLLNLLAFIAHMLLERGDRLYQRCLATTSRRELWHTLRTAMHIAPYGRALGTSTLASGAASWCA